MISKEQAEKVSDSIIEAGRKERNDSNVKKLNFIYGYILGEDVIEQYAHSPKRIRQAIKSAQNSWQVSLNFFGFLLLSACLFTFLDEPLNLIISVLVMLCGSGVVTGLIKLKAVRFLNESAEKPK